MNPYKWCLASILLLSCGSSADGEHAANATSDKDSSASMAETNATATSTSAQLETSASSSASGATDSRRTETSSSRDDDVSAQTSTNNETTRITTDGNGATSDLASEGDTDEPSDTTSTNQDDAGATTDPSNSDTTSSGEQTSGNSNPCVVQPLTPEFRASYDNLDAFYTKYADAAGLPVVSSDAPADEALVRVCELVIDMTMRADVRAASIDKHVRFAVIGVSELTNDIPEFAYLPDSINERARGLGGLPAASCAEENILCDRANDPWRGEGICVHEFAHTISLGGLYYADPTFEDRLAAAFENAKSTGLFTNTYALENAQEYWAEGVQDWYFTNLESDPPNGIHNSVDRREELESYDPKLYDLVAEFLPEPVQFVDCYSDE